MIFLKKINLWRESKGHTIGEPWVKQHEDPALHTILIWQQPRLVAGNHLMQETILSLRDVYIVDLVCNYLIRETYLIDFVGDSVWLPVIT